MWINSILERGTFAMTGTRLQNRPSPDEVKIAEQLVRARLNARLLTKYPGEFIADFAAGYRCQDAFIARWPERIGGWKVTQVLPPEHQSKCGEERFIGPAFASSIRTAEAGKIIECPVIEGGITGIEAEIVVRVGRNASPEKNDWSVDEASEMVGQFCIGLELVTSRFSKAALPTYTQQPQRLSNLVADCGFNNGIVAGESIAKWRSLQEIKVQVFVDGKEAHSGATTLRDGPLAGLAFTLSQCARRGYPLQAEATIATGTITGGLIPLEPGQCARVVFEGLGELECRAVQAMPQAHAVVAPKNSTVE